MLPPSSPLQRGSLGVGAAALGSTSGLVAGFEEVVATIGD
jgi:hypothetical protein